ncbi:MAG: ThuA domain-containing protein [Lentisphaeraceae bacterium]|nr:ThuA domain-containing protein [Lentisphaeraceae bacterium]
MKRLLLLFLASSFISTFAFAEKKNIYVINSANEYSTDVTLTNFCETVLKEDFNISYIRPLESNPNYLKNLQDIQDADLLIISTWRLALEKHQLQLIKSYIASGKPIIAIRTTTHGFSLRNGTKAPEGSAQWPTFDQEILGCKYSGHSANTLLTHVTLEKEQQKHELLKKVTPFIARSWLYKVSPLNPQAEVLLWGKTTTGDKEPVAWTFTPETGNKVFTTTLGHQEDFFKEGYIRLLTNAVYAALEKDAPDKINYGVFGPYSETHFPFFTQVLNHFPAHKKKLSKDVTARGLILKPGHDHFACFDTDLLRYSSIWKNGQIKHNSMTMGTYHLKTANKKSKGGELDLPTKNGANITSLRPIAGVEKGKSTWTDSRPKALDKNQVNNGPLPANKGKWNGIFLSEQGPVLSYSVDKTEVFENLTSRNYQNTSFLERKIHLVNADKKLFFHIGEFDAASIATTDNFVFIKNGNNNIALKLYADGPCRFVNKGEKIDLEVSAKDEINISILYWEGPNTRMSIFKNYQHSGFHFPDINRTPPKFWAKETSTKVNRGKAQANQNFVVDDIALPYINPYKRNVRFSAIAFFRNGKAALTTFDGDVWIASDLHSKSKVSWKRFASGLNELQGVVIKNEQIYVFGRSGIVRLHDRDKNGEADYYENFCSLIIQTAESREFPMAMELHPDGSFIIAKGGQRSQTLNPHAGSVIKIAADGKSYEVIATNLREPYLGVDPDTGDIFASDQQGHWTPATPFHVIKKDANYGFLPAFIKKHKKKIERATTWIPHRINQSGAGIFKVKSRKLTGLQNKLLYLDYNGPSLGVIYYDNKRPKQAAYIRLKEEFTAPLLKGAINPIDGLAYLTGFQIWGTKSSRTSGLSRLKPVKKHSTLPANITYFKQGVLLEFNSKIRPDSINPHLFKIERWNYLRTKKYGSGHYLLSGKAGQEKVGLSSVTLAKNGKSIFIAVPNMKIADQMSLSWRLIDEHNQNLEDSLYFSINELVDFTSKEKAEFPAINFNAKAISIQQEKSAKPSIALGKSTVLKLGCIGCHSEGTQKAGKSGPPWEGLMGATKEFNDGSKVTVDKEYIIDSILSPGTKIVKGYHPAMPSYQGVIPENELESIVLYIDSLK